MDNDIDRLIKECNLNIELLDLATMDKNEIEKQIKKKYEDLKRRQQEISDFNYKSKIDNFLNNRYNIYADKKIKYIQLKLYQLLDTISEIYHYYEYEPKYIICDIVETYLEYSHIIFIIYTYYYPNEFNFSKLIDIEKQKRQNVYEFTRCWNNAVVFKDILFGHLNESQETSNIIVDINKLKNKIYTANNDFCITWSLNPMYINNKPSHIFLIISHLNHKKERIFTIIQSYISKYCPKKINYTKSEIIEMLDKLSGIFYDINNNTLKTGYINEQDAEIWKQYFHADITPNINYKEAFYINYNDINYQDLLHRIANEINSGYYNIIYNNLDNYISFSVYNHIDLNAINLFYVLKDYIPPNRSTDNIKNALDSLVNIIKHQVDNKRYGVNKQFLRFTFDKISPEICYTNLFKILDKFNKNVIDAINAKSKGIMTQNQEMILEHFMKTVGLENKNNILLDIKKEFDELYNIVNEKICYGEKCKYFKFGGC